MRKLEKFLFSYSIIAITVLFICFVALSPQPLNLISGVVLSPIIFYFWIRITSPVGTSPDIWSVRFVVILVLISALGVYAFSTTKHSLDSKPIINQQLSEVQALNEELKGKITLKDTEIAKLKEQIKDTPTSSDVQGESIADLISESPAPPNGTQRITGVIGIKVIDVYQNPTTSSLKIGDLDPSINYPYIEKQGDWYKVVMTSSKTGWVESSQVIEVQ